MIYTLYNAKNGLISGITNSLNRAQMESYIEGSWPQDQFYIKHGEPKKFPPKPSTDSWHRYTWDLFTESWQLDEDATATAAREFRNNLFTYVDKVNAMWYESMSEQDQRVAGNFRRALLQVPEQAGFPVRIEWPNIPRFLRN